MVTVIWQYTGLSTPEMEQRVTTYSQYSMSSNVSGIRNMEAQSLNGLSIQKVYFQPDVNLDLAIAQIVAATNSIRALMPPGIQPPIVVQFNASSVPVLQISLTSDTLTEQQLYDYGIYRLRQQLAPVHGVTFPTPAGGKYRQIMVDLDPAKLLARGLTPLDVVNAVNLQNLTLPTGTTKIGDTQYTVHTNATPSTIDELNNIPIKVANGATVFVKDIGQVRDGSAVQQNIVREDGKRAVLLSVIKNGNASTLDVVNGVREALKIARAGAPAGLEINELFDQSVFVKSSVEGVLREGAIAAGLTALMILLFLGSWRSTVVVMISIPLAILSSLVALYFLGETLNTMTLGGLALAIGILVDDSTVTIENTHRLLTEEGDASAAGNPARLGRHCRADHGIDTGHQLRVCLGGLSRGTGQIPLHPARPCRRVRHACLLRAVADVDAHHDRPAAQGRAAWSSRGRLDGLVLPPASAISSGASSGCGRVTLRCSGSCSTRRIVVPIIMVAMGGLGHRDACLRRSRLLSSHRRRADPAACAGTCGDPHRNDGADFPGRRGQDQGGHSRARPRTDRRQHRPASARLQPCICGRLHDRRQ